MAIFRQGVRVGPFDLRLGLSRDKSLQNVEGISKTIAQRIYNYFHN